MTIPPTPVVLGRQIERARREHKLSPSILAMLAGLTEQQVQAIEQGGDDGFVNEAHRIDCARRIAVALGLPREHFLQDEAAGAEATATAAGEAAMADGARDEKRDEKRDGTRGVPREQWQHLPLASLEVLAPLRACALPPPATERRRSGSPMLVALLVCVALSLLMLGLSLLG